MIKAGTVLQNRYEVVRPIARGGMGALYEALDQRLGNTVALKETLVTDPQLRQAFEREARLLAGLNHPVLPGVKDHFVEDGGQFLVMDYIPGDDLAGLLSQRAAPFPLNDVLQWADDLLDALDYLHSQQPPIIHRDIKPQNLKLNQRGRIVLLDFGLAKGARVGNPDAALSTGQVASIFGYTPQYAPLEQIQGSGTAAYSDIYALAATLFQLLSQQTPPDALSRAAASVAGQPDPLPELSQLNPLVSPALSQVIRQAMAQNPRQRYASAREMQQALHAAASGAAPPPPSSAGIDTLVVTSSAPRNVALPATADAASAASTAVAPAPARGCRSTPLLLGSGIAMLLLLALGFCLFLMPLTRRSEDRAERPVNQPVAIPADRATPPPTNRPAGHVVPDDAGRSRSDPLPPDAVASIDGWQVQVLESIRGREAWNRIYEANQFADPPPEGMEYVIVRLQLQADFSGESLRQFYPKITGDRLRETASSGVPPAPALETELVGGQSSMGWKNFLVAVDEGNLMLKLEELRAPADAAPRFIALEPGARIPVDPQLRTIEPNRLGSVLSEPAAIGATTISEDWEVTLLEVVRGPAARRQIQTAARVNDPPPNGREYVLARFQVRSISTVDDARMLSRNDFASLPADSADPDADQLRSPVVVNLEPEIDSYLYPGGSSIGLVPLLAPEDEQIVIIFRPGFIDDQNTRFFAVDTNQNNNNGDDDDDEGNDDD